MRGRSALGITRGGDGVAAKDGAGRRGSTRGGGRVTPDAEIGLRRAASSRCAMSVRLLSAALPTGAVGRAGDGLTSDPAGRCNAAASSAKWSVGCAASSLSLALVSSATGVGGLTAASSGSADRTIGGGTTGSGARGSAGGATGSFWACRGQRAPSSAARFERRTGSGASGHLAPSASGRLCGSGVRAAGSGTLMRVGTSGSGTRAGASVLCGTAAWTAAVRTILPSTRTSVAPPISSRCSTLSRRTMTSLRPSMIDVESTIASREGRPRAAAS